MKLDGILRPFLEEGVAIIMKRLNGQEMGGPIIGKSFLHYYIQLEIGNPKRIGTIEKVGRWAKIAQVIILE